MDLFEEDNTPDYAYLYAKLNADREKKSKGGAIKQTLKEFLQMELKLKPEEDIFAQAKLFLKGINPEKIAAVSDSPQELNS